MNNFITSQIRTWVPIIIGSLVTWLGSTLDIILADDAAQGAVVFFTSLASGVYYLIARSLEARWPFFGFLLGKQSTPTYTQ